MIRTLAFWQPTDRLCVALEWNPRDVRVGAWWQTWPVDGADPGLFAEILIYLLPCLPIHFTWERPVPKVRP